MANTFLRKIAATTTADSPTTVYTVPALTSTVVIGFMVSNLLDSIVYITVEGASTNLGTDLPLPAGSSLSVLEGKMVLEAADTITVECDTLNGVEVFLSIMEIT